MHFSSQIQAGYFKNMLSFTNMTFRPGILL